MKISIIIPTRERAFYLKSSIQTVLDIEDDEIELIVADNASPDGTDEVVAGFDDPRLIYLPSEYRVSMRENFNRSVLVSTGEYVITFGDDDAILPQQFKYLRRLVEEHKPDGLSWNRAGYYWPVEGYGKRPGSVRFYKNRSFGPPESYDPAQQLDALLNCKMHKLVPAPNIYHGCVSRAYLDKHRPGRKLYFDGTIPDVNFQYRCIFNGGNFLHVKHPFTINGASPKSNGGSHLSDTSSRDAEKIARAFDAENKADPLADVIDHAQTIELVMLATLETIRARSDFSQHLPNYVNWYRYAMNGRVRKPQMADRIDATLKQHAEKTGTQAALRDAENADLMKKTVRERIDTGLEQIGNFKLSAERDGENNVLTAARMMDEVFGNGFEATVFEGGGKRRAWTASKTRSKSFDKRL